VNPAPDARRFRRCPLRCPELNNLIGEGTDLMMTPLLNPIAGTVIELSKIT
jgi:hypothetical protein